MDVKIPKTFLDNLNIVVKYQNIRLISDICKYMKEFIFMSLYQYILVIFDRYFSSGSLESQNNNLE